MNHFKVGKARKAVLIAQLEERAKWAMVEVHLKSAMEIADKKDKEILEAAFTVQTTIELQLMVERDLKLHRNLVY